MTRFVNGGELFKHLTLEGRFSEERSRFYAAELLLALEHLHAFNVGPSCIHLTEPNYRSLTGYLCLSNVLVGHLSVSFACFTHNPYTHLDSVPFSDLKPENILLDYTGHIALCDFGLCKLNMTDSMTTNTFCGTPEYLSPELLLGQAYT